MRSSTTKCSKRKGEYCRLHNTEPKGFVESDRRKFIMQGVIAFKQAERENKKHKCAPEAEIYRSEIAEREAKENAAIKAKHDWRVADMEKHMNLKVHPTTGEKRVSVFRAGVPNAPEKRGVETDPYLKADAVAPAGRQTRTTGIFASPTMHGVSKWVVGVSHVVNDWKVREIRVDPDKVYVYSVHAWERCSDDWMTTDEHRKAYWDTGITLTQWQDKLRKDPELDPAEWELLLSPDDMKAVKPVGAERVARSAHFSSNGEPDSYLMKLLK
jgi:hypothetical protein